MKKKLVGVLLFLMMVVGLCLIFNQQISDFLVKQMTTTEMHKKITSKTKKGTFDFSKLKEATMKSVLKARFIDSKNGVIGKIAVPAVNLKLPIYYGISNDNLLRGAGTMKKDQKMGKGNYTLAGHHMNNPNILFSPLAKAKVGEKVYLTNGKKVFVYKLNVKRRITKYQVEVINDVPNKKMITLITCDPVKGVAHTPYRILLQGNLVKVETATTKNTKVFE